MLTMPFSIMELIPILMAQPVLAQGVQVIAVEVKPTDKGLDVVLETKNGQPQVFTTSYGNTLIANIINSQLVLPQGNAFRQENPVAGIAAVTVTQQGVNSIRVTVTGKAGVPTAEVKKSDQGLILSLSITPPTTAAQPTPKPESITEAEPAQTSVPDAETDETETEPDAIRFS